MYELRVERTFRAGHALVIQGAREAPHEHDWHVTLVVNGATLDDDGLLCDFHDLERALEETIQPLRGVNLNHVSPFDESNPSAELVAKHLAESVAARLGDAAQVDRVTVTEAPGCAATYVLED
jgi:6-pyruvoyltetrahydropterin/6-carboxytetrahydropterin synthase